MTNSVAFDPNDPVQRGFLSALALGETGNSSYAATEGFGGVNLENHPTDQYGFPQWEGGASGTTHAAGIFQFEPKTWDSLASQFNLNFGSVSDQEAGGWYLAQQAYSGKTGRSLYDDLSSGNFNGVNSALQSIWPSVAGNAAAPQGLAASLAGGQGANLPFPVRLLTQPERLLVPALVEVRAKHHKAYLALLKTGSSAAAS